jgi:hypothetical protein
MNLAGEDDHPQEDFIRQSPRDAEIIQPTPITDELLFSTDVRGVDRELADLMCNVNLSTMDNR